MQYQYNITGMTCQGCVAKVKKTLENVVGISSADISLEENQSRLNVSEKPALATLQSTLSNIGNYQINEVVAASPAVADTKEESLLKSLYPLLLVFAFLIGAVVLRQFFVGEWNSMQFMTNFMGGFFVIFSFFKLLDLPGFVMAFRSYDPISKLWPGYAFVYPFIELALGIAFLWNFQLLWVNIITLIIVGIGTIGVAQKVLNKEAIQCACLGTVFNLPMTKITLTENSVMLVMAGWILVSMVG